MTDLAKNKSCQSGTICLNEFSRERDHVEKLTLKLLLFLVVVAAVVVDNIVSFMLLTLVLFYKLTHFTHCAY